MSEFHSVASEAVTLLQRMAQSKNPDAANAARLELSRRQAELADWTCEHEPTCRNPRVCAWKTGQ